MLIINMELNNMENLLFFTLGFISFKILKSIYIKTMLYLAFRKRRNIWVKPNFNSRLKYDKRLVR
jgi:hypothetical protein